MLVLTISLTLVLLPIAINVGTGGTAPDFLAPYVDWTWPVIGVLWLVAIVTGLFEFRSRRTVRHSARSADQPRNRPNALARVDRYLADRFAGSLASRTRLALALDVQPGGGDPAVRPARPAARQQRHRGPRGRRHRGGLRRPAGLDADPRCTRRRQDHAAARAGPIAGRAGSPRSRTARSRSWSDLSGWNGSTARHEDDDPGDSALLAGFVRWLLGELNSRYQIPVAVGRVWLRRGRLGLLLDGLDEVAVAHRDKLAPVLDELRPALPDRPAGRHLPHARTTSASTPPQAVRRCPHPPAEPRSRCSTTSPSGRTRAGRCAGRDRAGRRPVGPGQLPADAERDGPRLPGQGRPATSQLAQWPTTAATCSTPSSPRCWPATARPVASTTPVPRSARSGASPGGPGPAQAIASKYHAG